MPLNSAISQIRMLPSALVLVAALGLGACQTKNAALDADPMAGDPISTGSLGTLSAASPKQEIGSFKRTQELAQQWNANQGNVPLGLEYAANLQKIGQVDQQVEVLKSISVGHPNDGPLQSKLGKQLLAAGRFGEATAMLERAAAQPGVDWQTLSALGTAYDQQGSYTQARAKYQQALALKPNQLSVENNMAMSFALEGKLPEAEKLLRSAMTQPGVDAQPRVRQNLALVVGLQGRFDEARQIASADLPPEQVEANLNYLQQMLAQPNTWQQLSKQNQG
jgi:Flp pilus assembly protein TadD